MEKKYSAEIHVNTGIDFDTWIEFFNWTGNVLSRKTEIIIPELNTKEHLSEYKWGDKIKTIECFIDSEKVIFSEIEEIHQRIMKWLWNFFSNSEKRHFLECESTIALILNIGLIEIIEFWIKEDKKEKKKGGEIKKWDIIYRNKHIWIAFDEENIFSKLGHGQTYVKTTEELEEFYESGLDSYKTVSPNKIIDNTKSKFDLKEALQIVKEIKSKY